MNDKGGQIIINNIEFESVWMYTSLCDLYDPTGFLLPGWDSPSARSPRKSGIGADASIQNSFGELEYNENCLETNIQTIKAWLTENLLI